MKRLYFIYNLQSGKATIRAKLATVIDLCTKAGYEVTARATQAPMDACAVAEYACLQGYDMIVCSGGDGTLNEVTEGIMRSGVTGIPLGYIPCGSTNDFSRGLGIPHGIEAAAQWMLEGTTYPCDIGRFNDRHFIYVSAFGALVDVTYETSQNVKNVMGHAAYVLNGLSRLNTIRAYPVRITYGEEQTLLEDEFIFGMVTNTASVAGLLSLHDFQLDDGVFEVTLIRKPKNILDLRRIVSSLLNIQQDLDTKYIKCFRAAHICFHSDVPLPWTVDGENGGCLNDAAVENLHRAITFAIGGPALKKK